MVVKTSTERREMATGIERLFPRTEAEKRTGSWPYKLAMAGAGDAANARMRKAGRTKWNRADWNHMVREFERLYPLARIEREEFDAQNRKEG
jgi:hypothetical protein